jgi:hypothetical protein
MFLLTTHRVSTIRDERHGMEHVSPKKAVVIPEKINKSLEFFMDKPLSPADKTDKLERDVKDESAMVKDFINAFGIFFGPILNRLLDQGSDVTPDPNPRVAPKVIPDAVAPRPDPAITPLPSLSNKRKGEKADSIWSGFRQGSEGNCVTVSAIKVAMEKFGQSPTDIYKEVQKTAQGYKVAMRDGFRLDVTHAELLAAAQVSQFVGRDRGMLKDANFLYAVSAKRAQMENNDGRAARSFSAALHSLNDGEDERGAGEGFLRLGLRKHMKKVSVRELARGQLGMVNRDAHSVAVIDGREELWGRKGGTPRYGDAIALV